MQNYIYETLDNGETQITKFGTAHLWGGEYIITSREEGNNRKKLSRLIYEDHNNTKIPKNMFLNHKDGDKLNNDPSNLEILSEKEYWNQNHPMKKKNVKKRSSIKKTKTGLYHVTERTGKNIKSRWRHHYIKNGVSVDFCSNNILTLKEKAKERNLEWEIIDEDKAKKTADECGVSLSDLA